MHVKSLLLRNWRLYEEAFFEFSPQINSIIGPNAQGKTSLLEALYYLVSGRSCRNAEQKDLIRQGASYFYLEACFVRNEIEQRLKISFDGKERKIFFNSTLCPSPSSLLGLLKGVVMVPDDAALIKGSPNSRRQFLDYQIGQVDPLYVHHLMRYMRAMRQRNCLLKSRQIYMLEPWEREMATSAAYLVHKRRETVLELEAMSRRKYGELSATEALLKIVYKGGEGDPEAFQKRYLEMREREMGMGFTLFGPHRDELQILLDAKEARLFASEGQQRSCVAALRLSEWERLSQMAAERPLMLMDDVGMSLDAKRAGHLLKQLEGMGQVFLTATAPLPVSGHVVNL